jgi:hypothetical protein
MDFSLKKILKIKLYALLYFYFSFFIIFFLPFCFLCIVLFIPAGIIEALAMLLNALNRKVFHADTLHDWCWRLDDYKVKYLDVISEAYNNHLVFLEFPLDFFSKKHKKVHYELNAKKRLLNTFLNQGGCSGRN